MASFQAHPLGQAMSDVTYPCSRPDIAGSSGWVEVVQDNGSSWTFKALEGHPAHPGVVHFQFFECRGEAATCMTVTGVSSAPNPAGSDFLYDQFSTYYWGALATAIP